MKYNGKYIEPVMLFLFWLVCFAVICIVGISNVFADTYENIGYLNDYSDVLVEVSYTASPLPLKRTDTYQLEQVDAMNIHVSNFVFSAGITYSIEFSTPNTALSYANAFTVTGIDSNNNSVSCSTVGISYDDIKYLNFKFNCSSTVNELHLRIFNSSNDYIMDTGLFSWSYVYLRRVTRSTDTTILESQNSQIIQGQQDIINNQNQNTEKEIESQKVCNVYDNNKVVSTGFLTSNGSIDSSYSTYGVTDYIKVSSSSSIEVLVNYSDADAANFCVYNINKTLIRCYTLNNLNNFIFTSDISYLRSSIWISQNKPQFKICSNGNQSLNDSITGLNDSLNDVDSSGATNSASDFFSGFTTDTFGLTSIITAPLNLIGSITSSTCSPLGLPLPYVNKTLELPCMSYIYSEYFGSFFTMYQTITYGIIAYWVIVRIFNLVKDFKNPEHDEIEVLDL